MPNFKSQSAFSLVEFIIVIVITGIIATSIATFITLPVQGFIDLSRRATLVYSAESALRRMQRDIRRALPNSIRVSGDTAIEMINTVEGARYRADAPFPPPGGLITKLSITGLDTDFNVLGNLNSVGENGLRVAINNTGDSTAGVPVPGRNAYSPDPLDPMTNEHVVTPNGQAITISNTVTASEDHIKIGGLGFQFSDYSLSNRMYLVDGGISYICTGGQLLRYELYNFTNDTQPTAATPPPVTPAVMADNIGSCKFTYTAGSPARSGLMTLALSVTDADTGETVRLLHQVHVDNVP